MRLKSTRTKVRSDRIEGKSLQVLEGETRYGLITVWLDPASDYAPVRLRQKKSGDDLMGEVPLSSLKASGDDRQDRPNLPLRGVDFQVDYRMALIDGKRAVTGFLRLDRLIYEGGAEFSLRCEVTLKNIRFDPKPAELERTIPIPEGTPVSVRGERIRARWEGGRVVVDPASLPKR